MTRSHAQQLITARSAEIRRRFAVHELSLFGSTARDEASNESDVDILVAFDGKATFDIYMNLKFFLEEILGAKVDLVTVNGMKEEIRSSVRQEAVRVA